MTVSKGFKAEASWCLAEAGLPGRGRFSFILSAFGGTPNRKDDKSGPSTGFLSRKTVCIIGGASAIGAKTMLSMALRVVGEIS